MSGIRDFISTHRFSLKILEAGSFDCEAYEIWLNEFDGRSKLATLDSIEPMVAAGSSVHRYAELLVGQMNALLAHGCSEELLLATYEFCDRLFDMVTEAIEADSPADSPVGDIDIAVVAAAATSDMAMAA